MAAQAEYGPHLQARITTTDDWRRPCRGGSSVTQALAFAQRDGALPDLVVSLGSAGSRRLEQCGVYQATSVSYRDMDATALGFAKGQTPFLDLPPVLPLATLPGLPTATLSTGANIVSGAAYDGIDADMVDMETYAVLRACQAFGVPLLALRGISDGADELGHVDDWTQYLHIIDEKLAAAVELIERTYRVPDWPCGPGGRGSRCSICACRAQCSHSPAPAETPGRAPAAAGPVAASRCPARARS